MIVVRDFLNEDGSVNYDFCKEYNDTVLFRFDGDDIVCVKPSRDLSNWIGLKVYQEYKLPYNWSSDDLELLSLTFFKDFNLINELYDIISKLNPAIKDFYVDNNNRYKYDVLLGMGSEFNLEDISEFINGGAGYIKRMDSNYSIKLSLIENEVGNYIQYVPSYSTIDIVYNHLF